MHPVRSTLPLASAPVQAIKPLQPPAVLLQTPQQQL